MSKRVILKGQDIATEEFVEEKISEAQIPQADLINKIDGVILWENESPSSTFTSQSVTLSESLSNYNYYSIIYKNVANEDKFYNTGKIPVGHGCRLTEVYASTMNYSMAIRERQVSYSDDTTLSIEGGLFASAETAKTTNDDVCIPISVIGY